LSGINLTGLFKVGDNTCFAGTILTGELNKMHESHALAPG